MIIAIDGPAASGKSTAARSLARELGLPFLDTGAMYRAVTLAVLQRGVDPADGEACGRVAAEVRLDFDSEGRISIDGRPGEPAIRGPEVTGRVSDVAAHPAVRETIVPKQREIAARRGAVAEGRDTTTVVFPSADHKFFLVATSVERARRRAGELGTPEALEEIRADLERRDAIDSGRAHSPLVEAPDAIRVDTDNKTAADVLSELLGHVRSRESGGRGAAGRAEEAGRDGAVPRARSESEPYEPLTNKTWVYRAIMGLLVHPFYRLLFRARVEGDDKLPPGGALLASNHQSFLDIPLVALGASPRHVAFLARDTLAKTRWLAYVMDRCGAILVQRGSADRKALRYAAAHLEHGDLVTFFPEGTRTSDGSVGEFKRGAVLAAKMAGVPVVPVAIVGSFDAWPRQRRWPRPRKMVVRFGDPLDPSDPETPDRLHAAVLEMVARGR